MGRKHKVQTVQEPVAESVEEYRQQMLSSAPNKQLANQVTDEEIQCTCCTQEAPGHVAAMLKVADQTPTTVDLQGQKGKTVWICADCYTHGVRPLYVKFGDITWNQEGKRIKQRAEKKSGHPW